MKKLGIVLALLVLASVAGQVSAYTNDFSSSFTFDGSIGAGSYRTLYYKYLDASDWVNTSEAFRISFDMFNYSVLSQDSYQPDFDVMFFDDTSTWADGLDIHYITGTSQVSSGNTKIQLKYAGSEIASVTISNTWINHHVEVFAENGTITLKVTNIDTNTSVESTSATAWTGGLVIKAWGVRAYMEGGGSVGYDSTKQAIHIAACRGGNVELVADLDNLVINYYVFNVQFSIKDALTGQPLSGVTVKEGSTVLGTIDNGQSLELTKGTHELTFEKSGYWSASVTVDVQADTSVNVELYPDTAAFKLENFPSDITIPENTIYTLTFTLSPIQTSATYNTYLSLSGLSDIIEVRKDGSLVSPENGKYYLGDISSPIQVSIKFKAGAVGTHGFTLTLTSNDAIMSQTYTTTKQVTYQVEPLPFSVQMPSEWQVGENQLRISESSGQSYLITAVLKDSQGNEVWSDSYAFSPYEAHTFSINVPSEGSYTLELTWNGQTAVYDVQVNPAITLVTKTLTVQEGGEGTIVLHFKNPSSNVQYYTIKVSGGFLPAEINQSISVAPLTEKDVSIAFAVPEDLTYDAYELNVAVYQGDSVVFSDNVAVTIDSGGFTLFGGGSNTPTWAYALLGLLIVGGLVWALRRRR